jgi:isoleucyl-tRNA synthetase
VRQVQQLRKEADLEIEQRIQIYHAATDSDVLAALQSWGDYIREETLADSLQAAPAAASAKSVLVGALEIPLWIERSR